MLTTSKVTFLLPLSTQSQPPMHPTLQINFPLHSDPFLTSMPQSKPKQLSKDPTLHGLTRNSPSQAGTQSTWAMLASLEVSLWPQKFRAQCNSVRSLISKAKSSFLSNLVTESSTNPRTLWKTLNTILHRNPSNSLPESPDTSSLPTHSLTFSKIKLIASAPNFYHLIPLIRFFLHLPHLQRWPILFQPLSLKFTNSFLLLKVNNVPWIPSQLSFWNSASMNSVQSSQILSISLFLKEFSHRHSNKLLSSLFSKNHLYPLMISTTFVQFQTSSSFPKFSRKLLLPAFNLTCLLTHCLLLSVSLPDLSFYWNYSS